MTLSRQGSRCPLLSPLCLQKINRALPDAWDGSTNLHDDIAFVVIDADDDDLNVDARLQWLAELRATIHSLKQNFEGASKIFCDSVSNGGIRPV